MRTKKRVSRIVWDAKQSLVCAHLINHGFHGDTIGALTGLSRSQVYYRAKRLGVHLRDYRDGKGPIAHTVIRRFKVTRMQGGDVQELHKEIWPIVARRLQEHKK